MKIPSARKVYIGVMVILLALLILSEIAIMVGLMPGDRPSSYREDWYGYSDTVETLESEGYEVKRIVSSASLLLQEENPEETLFMTLAPGRPYSLTEILAIRKFHSRGGKGILADDTSNINDLIRYYDVNIVEGQVYDEIYLKSPDFPKVDVSSVDLFSGTIVMNRPASLNSRSGRVILNTTSSGWVDRNGNGIRDVENQTVGETSGLKRLGVITNPSAGPGEGNFVILSDPSLFSNEMLSVEDNQEFMLSAVEYLLPDGGTIIVDESTHSLEGPEGAVQSASRGIVILTTDINFKIVSASLVIIILLSSLYVFDPPKRHGHVDFLDRTGLAELMDSGIGQDDIPELKSIFLDRVRQANGLSTEQFSQLSWEELKGMIDNDMLFDFVRSERHMSKDRLEKVLLEVLSWR